MHSLIWVYVAELSDQNFGHGGPVSGAAELSLSGCRVHKLCVNSGIELRCSRGTSAIDVLYMCLSICSCVWVCACTI